MKTSVEFDPFRGGEISRTAPSTEPQREIITSAFMGGDANTAFNEAVSLRVSGSIDPALIEKALQVIVGRHDALRMTFTLPGDELCVTAHHQFALEQRELRGTDATAQEAHIQALWHDLVRTPMDLQEGPLFRAVWIQLGDDLGELVLLAHHVICDGWSFHVILEELAKLCSGVQAADLPAAPSFADFAELQNARAVSNADADYWFRQFESSPPVLDLPTDRARPAFRSFRAARIDYVIGAGLAKSMAAAAGKLRASVVNVALAGTAALLHRLTATTRMAIGLPVARQGAEDLPDLVGHGVQLLPILIEIEPGDPFQDIVNRAKTAIFDAREHFDFTFGALIRDLGLSGDPSRVPLVPVIFNIDQPFAELRLGAASATLRTVPRSAENFEIFLNILPTQNQLIIEATFNTDLFSADTIRAWLAALESLLADGTANPAKPVADLRLAEQCPEVYARLNDTVRQHAPGTWLDRFADAAATAPDTIAVVDEQGAMSYAELARGSEQLARVLVQRGVTRGALVGLYMTRSREMLVALLAVHKAGAAYLPLDPSFPESRLAFMLEDSGARWLLTDVDLPPALADTGVDVLSLPYPGAAPAPDLPLPGSGTADLAYMIYTSGSTGKPKGVEILHGGVVNFLDSMAIRPGLTRADTLLAVTTLSFDIAVLELLLPLTLGARVVVASRDQSMDAQTLAALINRHEVTVMQATPATWRLLLGDGWAGRRELTALCGGESLPAELATALLGRVGALWNLYGPTETTIWSTCTQIMPGTNRITIGRPIDNTLIYIMDSNGEALPSGVPGEICIGGAGVARGYHARPELTAEQFIESPHFGRLYRTGDRGRVLPDATVEHLGRLDFQVKVRGYRIELGEIEAVLASQPMVAQAVVVTREDQPDDTRLVAYLVARPGTTVVDDALRAHLQISLPDYMVPQHFVTLPAIPLLPNGKIDRKALPAPDAQVSRTTVHVAPRSEVEQAIAGEMAVALGQHDIGVNDDFFALGGHSLLAAQLASRLNRRFGTNLSMRTFFEAPTVARLAQSIAVKSVSGTAEGTVVVKRLQDQSRAPVSLLQERLWLLEELYPGRPTYHAPSAHRLRGPLNEAAFEQAFREIIRRQTSLRTCIRRDKDMVVQCIRDDVQPVLFPAEDLSLLPPAERDNQLHRRLDELTAETFDLTQAPLFRAHMFCLGEQEHVFFFMPHHIIWDGWSFDLMYDEMSALYGAFCEGRRSPLPELAVSYGDFAAWHREWAGSTECDHAVLVWRERLNRVGRARELPTDKPRRPGMSGQGNTEWLKISASTTDALRSLARRHDVTMSTMMLAAYSVLLYGYAQQTSLAIGMPVRGRNAPDLESIMGYFNTLLPLHFEIQPDQGFDVLIERVQAAIVESLPFADVPLERLSRELNFAGGDNRAVLYQALFSFQDARQRRTQWGALNHEMIPLFQRGATEDLGLWFMETAQGMQGGVTYNTEILTKETVELLRGEYFAILDTIIAAPSTAVSTLAHALIGRRVLKSETPAPVVVPVVYTAPRNDLEIGLATVWARVLGVESVGITDNFFELGGNSLSLLNLSIEMQEATGIVFDLGDVFRFQTIKELVASLDAETKKQAAVTVPLQREGKETPVFCLVGVNLYREFAKSLGKGQPVYGVYVAEEQAITNQAIQGITPVVSIERLVDAYYNAIVRLRPSGPYRLAGLSFGGIVAMEVASKMRHAGAEVDVVFLLDTLLPHGHRRNWTRWLRSKAAEILTAGGRHNIRASWQRFRNRFVADRLRLDLKDRVDLIGNAAAVRHAAYYQATMKWQARSLVSDFNVVLFRAADHLAWGEYIELDEDYGWRRYVGERLHVINVAGDHLSIVDPPNVAGLGEKARAFLKSGNV